MPPDQTLQTPPDYDGWATLRRFLPYLWPRDRPDLRMRIVIAMILVLLAKAGERVPDDSASALSVATDDTAADARLTSTV